MRVEAILQVVSRDYYQPREPHKTWNVLIKGDDGGTGEWVESARQGERLLMWLSLTFFASNSEHLISSRLHDTPMSRCYSERKRRSWSGKRLD